MMNSVKNARQRILQYPKALSECSTQALAYGKCVSVKENVGKFDCQKEFEALKQCVQRVVSKK